MNKKRLKNKNVKKIFKNIFFSLVTLGLISVGFLIFWISALKLPDFKSFNDRKIQSSTKIYDKTGEILLYDLNQDVKRTIIPYEEMGVNILNATVAIEDSEFYKHRGIRISSILRATVWAKLSGKKVQGGSTITQQLIKNTLLTPERSLTRKIKEWILSLKVEKIMSKEEILTLYLNEAPYGGSIYGIEEATKSFFGKKPQMLSLAEAAYLAAIPNGPTYYSPYRKNKDKLDERKNLVLRRMLNLNFITEGAYNQAINEEVVFLPEQRTKIFAPHFVFFVKNYLEKKYGTRVVEEGGLKVITTLDYDLQKRVEEIALVKAKENEELYGGKNTAVVILDPKTGQILSMLGSRDYFDTTIDGNFNVSTALRQPGSSFKPIVYALAFEKGYTEKTVLFDVKTEFNPSCSPLGNKEKPTCYSPNNHDGGFRGPINLRTALAQSINVIAVKLLYLVGVQDSIKLSHNLGITSLNEPARYGLSLVIGGGETSLLDMTSVYGVFANEGTRNPYQFVLEIKNNKNKTLESYSNKSYQVLKPNTARILSDILSDNVSRTPTFGASSNLFIPDRQVAVKTGTTNDNKDAWTIGYTPSVVVGVWVGNNDNVPMKKGGAAMAGPIWNSIMREVLKNQPKENFNKPEEIDNSLPPILRGFWQGGQTFKIDKISGGLITEYTPFDLIEEKSITEIHNILHWLDKKNPLNPTFEKITDPQYNNWEYGVQKWWENNFYNYQIIKKEDVPIFYDNVHTEESKLVFEIIGLSDLFYDKKEKITFSVSTINSNAVQKIDVFINNIYLTSLKKDPFSFSFIPQEINIFEGKNTLKIIGYDLWGNSGEQNISFSVR